MQHVFEEARCAPLGMLIQIKLKVISQCRCSREPIKSFASSSSHTQCQWQSSSRFGNEIIGSDHRRRRSPFCVWIFLADYLCASFVRSLANSRSRCKSPLCSVVVLLKCVQSRCDALDAAAAVFCCTWETFSRSIGAQRAHLTHESISPSNSMQLSNYCIKLLPQLYITRYLTTATVQQ